MPGATVRTADLTSTGLLDRVEATLRRAAVGRMGAPARACAADAAGTITVFGFPVPADDAGRATLAASWTPGWRSGGQSRACWRREGPDGGRAEPRRLRLRRGAPPAHRRAVRRAVAKTLRTRVTRRAGSVGAHSRPVATCAAADARPVQRAAGGRAARAARRRARTAVLIRAEVRLHLGTMLAAARLASKDDPHAFADAGEGYVSAPPCAHAAPTPACRIARRRGHPGRPVTTADGARPRRQKRRPSCRRRTQNHGKTRDGCDSRNALLRTRNMEERA
jgi:hypothetical protein